jgi:hypothetical protein
MDQRRKLMETADQWTRWEQVLKASKAVAGLGDSAKGLRQLVEKRQGHLDIAQAFRDLEGRWIASEAMEAKASYILASGPRVLELRQLMEERRIRVRTATLLRDLVERWSEIKVSTVDWEPIARGAKILRARLNRAQAIREQIAGLQSFRFTCEGLEATIEGAGKLVAELVAQRPASCPLCGGPMHTGEH